MNLQENIQRIKTMMGILTEETKDNKDVLIFADGVGNEFGENYEGPTKKISIKDTIPNEPFKDDSYMEKNDMVKSLLKAIKNGEELPPIKVIKHPYDPSIYVTIDGHHRRYSYLKSGVDEVDAVIIPHKDIVLMKSMKGEKLGRLSELKDNKKVIDKYFSTPDGKNKFKIHEYNILPHQMFSQTNL